MKGGRNHQALRSLLGKLSLFEIHSNGYCQQSTAPALPSGFELRSFVLAFA